MIREMAGSDVKGVALLEKECFSMPWSEKSLLNELDNKDSIFVVCELDDRIVGYAGMYLVYPEGDITNVAVASDYRGRGIATDILADIFRRAGNRQVTEFTLEVRVSNYQAINLYEKMGFTNEGIRKNFYDNPKEDAYIMWRKSDNEEGEIFSTRK